jgi:periplasmic protein TonB
MTGEGYLAKRSHHNAFILPVAAAHGGLIALLMLPPFVAKIVGRGPEIDIINIPVNKPKPIDPPKSEPVRQKPIVQKLNSPEYAKSAARMDGSTSLTGKTGAIETGFDEPLIEAPIIEPLIEPIAPPIIVGARDDPRYGADRQPPYPPGLERAEIEGKVSVRVLIGIDGRVKEVEPVGIVQAEFFKSTRDWALRKWRFKPATRDGAPYESWVTKTIWFQLDR